MIVSKMIVNAVATRLAKHFRLDKIMSYVFDDNELDEKVSEIIKYNKATDNRLNLLEKMAHSPKDFKCNYKTKEGEINE